MIDYQPLYNILLDAKADAWVNLLPGQITSAFNTNKHGTLSQWQSAIKNLPEFPTTHRLLNADAIQTGQANDLSEADRMQLEQLLRSLHPWRKGPYNLFGINIDTEWRSDWKWDRLKNHITPLNHRLVLDVGCGNGYHCWRMLGAGAKMVVGIDPLLLNVMQFQLIRKLHGEAPIYVLPLGIEELPYGLKLFDTVFSMGVLYHRRSPIDHLMELKDCLKPGGELVLETLVIDGGLGEVLLPEDRYAKMRNVWFLPTCETLISWLKRCGFKNIRLIDVTPTSIEEQRSTEWMQFHSLKDFLDPENPELTCEGLPAPKRAIVIANNA
ncbi:tRNA 5-methoxyuridine(34)/uridine 5-oxyacetic acid(34) synthase CmoB [Methylobacter sp. S3L5C]|uniref:tRNA 5-methoxyuridine(34)/uridine 5-oxyacetic acid(34) synthase CmoB n=1 Tax=Methylobacter sp. S3L5C TaxID=2839024 RepID=UPI001FAD6921|nr:tRNA 5-methoxyuridine(34)/uridine 5-oxyacetic acid(34) synthase CmoB [Methylobacter sp. S3L5C]UOA09961.1 tRNA 5-methoxyuridine(34)/uridine 5-oxyacetic acid(34) synthase CmoB [Methylobacter sp. S3L5C]